MHAHCAHLTTLVTPEANTRHSLYTFFFSASAFQRHCGEDEPAAVTHAQYQEVVVICGGLSLTRE